MQYKTIIFSFLVIMVFLGLTVVSARPAYLESFKQQYDTEDTKLDTCNTCHINPNGGGTRNPYGMAYQESGMDFVAIESLDSDDDGFSNIEEVRSLTFPGNSEDSPGTGEIDPSEVTVVNESQEPSNVSKEQTDTEDTDEGLISKQQAPGFGAILTITGLLATIYWFRK